jgi:protocatechuate 3,4-dioxygenase alpha subunit
MANEDTASSHQATVSQTAGPYFHIGLRRLFSDQVADADAVGRHIVVEGRVLDGDGVPVSDALIELWQADPNGKYAHPHDLDDLKDKSRTPGFRGFARVPTNDDGVFRFTTVKPGRVPAPDGAKQAPHILVSVFMRGLLRQAVTRIYFSDEPSNEEDLVLGCVPAPRRSTLIAKRRTGQPDVFDWDIVLQGPHETAFFDY